MVRLSLNPDRHLQWTYDFRHPDYNTKQAEDLRTRRARALQACPQWLLDQAYWDDEHRSSKSDTIK